MEKAIFAAGCFWGVEAAFRRVPGVVDAVSGYCGGAVENPTYEEVCRGDTGHAEAVEVTFDPAKVDFTSLLEVFWQIHDPTTLNRQGLDVGSQYRSAIFYFGREQLSAAEESRDNLVATDKIGKKIVTQIVPAWRFYRAESYHQRYLEKRSSRY